MIKIFIDNFCNLFYPHLCYLYFLNQVNPTIIVMIIVICFSSIFLFISVIVLNYFLSLKERFYKENSDFQLEYFPNYFNENEFIHIIMNYKSHNLKKTLLKSILLLSPILFVFLILRILRLGTSTNLLNLYQKFMEIPFFLKIIFVIFGTLYVILIRIIYTNITIRLFYELKKLYIYLFKFGTYLDPNHFLYSFDESRSRLSISVSTTPYIEEFLFSFIKKTSPFGKYYSIYNIFKQDEEAIKNRLYQKNFNTVFFYVPFIYFGKFSKLFPEHLKNTISNLYDSFYKNMPKIFIIIPWIILVICLLFELYHNHFILSYYYYIILYIYIYNQYISLCTFLWYSNEILCCKICMYYYITIEELRAPNLYGKILMENYCLKTKQQYEKHFLFFLASGLNSNVAGIYARRLSGEQLESNTTQLELWLLSLYNRFVCSKIIVQLLKINKRYLTL